MKIWLSWAGWGGLALIVAAIAAYRMDWVGLMSTFGALMIGAVLVALVGVIALAYMIVVRRFDTGLMTLHLVGWLPVICLLTIVGVDGMRAPPIHDITTDIENPPQFHLVRSERKPSENSLEYGGEEVAAQQRLAYSDIVPGFVEAEPEVVLQVAVGSIEQLGWQYHGIDSQRLQLEATERTTLFGFADDVVVRVQPAEGGSQVDVRSISRVGVGDLGANAKRIRRFFDQFCQDVQSELAITCQ